MKFPRYEDIDKSRPLGAYTDEELAVLPHTFAHKKVGCEQLGPDCPGRCIGSCNDTTNLKYATIQFRAALAEAHAVLLRITRECDDDRPPTRSAIESARALLDAGASERSTARGAALQARPCDFSWHGGRRYCVTHSGYQDSAPCDAAFGSLAAALAEARQEIARLSAELADARGWLREHAKWACGHISEGTGGEPEVCRICAVQDSEAAARRALEWIRNRANDPSPFGPMHVLTEITERARAALAAEPDGTR